MEKLKIGLAFILIALLLCPYIVIPASMSLEPTNNVETSSLSPTYTTLSTIAMENGTEILNVTKIDLSLSIYEATLTQYHLMIDGGEYVQFEVCSKTMIPVGERRIKYYPSCKLITEPYPISKLVEGLEILASSDPMPKYEWDGITFVQAHGNSTHWVKYDHPDNYDTYHPLEINVDYQLKGTSTTMWHIAQYHIEDAKEANDLGLVISSLVAIIGGLLALPELGSKFVAGVVSLIVAILVGINRVVSYFLNDILQTELGDGWSYLWGFGNWWLFHWFWMSFGAWRDWGWFYIFICAGGDLVDCINLWVWIDAEYYWNGMLCNNVFVYYFDGDWNYLGYRFFRCIKYECPRSWLP